MSDILIEARNIEKDYPVGDGQWVRILKDITLSIHSGEIVIIYGPSGAGKTTLLHILSSLDNPTKGDILYRTRAAKDMTPDDLSEFRNGRFGFVFQFHYLLQEFTVLENVLMPAMISGQYFRARENFQTRAIELLSFMGIGTKTANFPAQISGGESQRVAIARSLIMQPDIVFMDEPTGNLDRRTGKEIIDLIDEINKIKKIGFIIVSHDEAVLRMEHKRINLVDGVLL